MNILIPIEIVPRELNYKLFLSNILASKGFNCYLGKKSEIYYLLHKMKDYIYIDKGYHKNKSEIIYQSVKKNNGIIINLDEEGGIDFKDNSTLLDIRYTEDMIRQVDYIFLWGKYQYNLIKNLVKDKDKVIVTGHPRFELLKKRYHSIYKNEVQSIISRYRDFILINTNMGWGNNIRGEKFVVDNYSSRHPDLLQLISKDKRKIDSIVKLIKLLSKAFDKKIILRPHPEEDKEYYRDIFHKHDNVHVVFEGTVIPWILSSNLMIHTDCTTGIESLLLGKKPISLLPKNFNYEKVAILPLEASDCFTDPSDIVNFLKSINFDNSVSDYTEFDFIENHFSFSNEVFSDISEYILELKTNISNPNESPLSIWDLLYLKFKSLIKNFRNRDKSKISKMEGFSFRNINNIDSIYRKINPVFKENKLKKLTKNLYLISKNSGN